MTEKEKEAKGVDSVTDYVAEREDDGLNAASAGLLLASHTASVMDYTISGADLTLLQEELDITKDMAETMLRKHSGNITDALSSFIRGN